MTEALAVEAREAVYTLVCLYPYYIAEVTYQLSYTQRIVLSEVIHTLLCSVYKLILYRLVVRLICSKCISSVKRIFLSRFSAVFV